MSRFYVVEFQLPSQRLWHPWRRDGKKTEAVREAKSLVWSGMRKSTRVVFIDTDRTEVKSVWMSRGAFMRNTKPEVLRRLAKNLPPLERRVIELVYLRKRPLDLRAAAKVLKAETGKRFHGTAAVRILRDRALRYLRRRLET